MSVTAMARALTSAEVEEKLTALRELLQEIGPIISGSLTQLILREGEAPASKTEALKFLASHLATVRNDLAQSSIR